MRVLVSLATVLLFVSSGLAQQTSLSPQTPPKALPDLEHFNTANVDAKAEPCDDFYKYADRKWLAAHPIPADQVTWGVGSPLNLWNETVLLLALEQNSANDPKRTPSEQKVGDYYFACMDTKGIEAHAKEWLKPELDRIARISSKSDIAEELAHLHQTIPGAWAGNDNQTNAALFGYSGQPDFDDASHNIAMMDQGGMSLPGRSFYLDQDDKAKEIRAKYLKHVAHAGESAHALFRLGPLLETGHHTSDTSLHRDLTELLQERGGHAEPASSRTLEDLPSLADASRQRQFAE